MGLATRPKDDPPRLVLPQRLAGSGAMTCQLLKTRFWCLAAFFAAGSSRLPSARAEAPSFLFDGQLDPELNGAFAVSDGTTGRAFAALKGGTLACFDLAAGGPCHPLANTTIAPGIDAKLLGCMGRTEEDTGITLLLGKADQSWLVSWPDDTRKAPSANPFRWTYSPVAWQAANCTGTSGVAADSETTIVCSVPKQDGIRLWGLTRTGSLFEGYINMPVQPSRGLGVLLAGLSASPVLRQGGVWLPPYLKAPTLAAQSSPFGENVAYAAVLDAPSGLNAIAGVAIDAGYQRANAFAFAARAGDLPVVGGASLPWKRPLWTPCFIVLSAIADSGRGVSAFGMNPLGCLWGRHTACLTLLSTSNGNHLWEACGSDLNAAVGQAGPVNATLLRAVFLPGSAASITTAAALVAWQPSDFGLLSIVRRFSLLSIALDPELPGGGPTVNVTSQGLGDALCEQGDIQAVDGGIVAVMLSGCDGDGGSRLLSLRVAPPTAASASPRPSLSPAPMQASATAGASSAAPGQSARTDGAAIIGAAVATTLLCVGLAGAGVWWWAYRRALPLNRSGLMANDSMASLVQAPQSIDPADEW